MLAKLDFAGRHPGLHILQAARQSVRFASEHGLEIPPEYSERLVIRLFEAEHRRNQQALNQALNCAKWAISCPPKY